MLLNRFKCVLLLTSFKRLSNGRVKWFADNAQRFDHVTYRLPSSLRLYNESYNNFEKKQVIVWLKIAISYFENLRVIKHKNYGNIIKQFDIVTNLISYTLSKPAIYDDKEVTKEIFQITAYCIKVIEAMNHTTRNILKAYSSLITLYAYLSLAEGPEVQDLKKRIWKLFEKWENPALSESIKVMHIVNQDQEYKHAIMELYKKSLINGDRDILTSEHYLKICRLLIFNQIDFPEFWKDYEEYILTEKIELNVDFSNDKPSISDVIYSFFKARQGSIALWSYFLKISISIINHLPVFEGSHVFDQISRMAKYKLKEQYPQNYKSTDAESTAYSNTALIETEITTTKQENGELEPLTYDSFNIFTKDMLKILETKFIETWSNQYQPTMTLCIYAIGNTFYHLGSTNAIIWIKMKKLFLEKANFKTLKMFTEFCTVLGYSQSIHPINNTVFNKFVDMLATNTTEEELIKREKTLMFIFSKLISFITTAILSPNSICSLTLIDKKLISSLEKILDRILPNYSSSIISGIILMVRSNDSSKDIIAKIMQTIIKNINDVPIQDLSRIMFMLPKTKHHVPNEFWSCIEQVLDKDASKTMEEKIFIRFIEGCIINNAIPRDNRENILHQLFKIFQKNYNNYHITVQIHVCQIYLVHYSHMIEKEKSHESNMINTSTEEAQILSTQEVLVDNEQSEEGKSRPVEEEDEEKELEVSAVLSVMESLPSKGLGESIVVNKGKADMEKFYEEILEIVHDVLTRFIALKEIDKLSNSVFLSLVGIIQHINNYNKFNQIIKYILNFTTTNMKLFDNNTLTSVLHGIHELSLKIDNKEYIDMSNKIIEVMYTVLIKRGWRSITSPNAIINIFKVYSKKEKILKHNEFVQFMDSLIYNYHHNFNKQKILLIMRLFSHHNFGLDTTWFTFQTIIAHRCDKLTLPELIDCLRIFSTKHTVLSGTGGSIGYIETFKVLLSAVENKLNKLGANLNAIMIIMELKDVLESMREKHRHHQHGHVDKIDEKDKKEKEEEEELARSVDNLLVKVEENRVRKQERLDEKEKEKAARRARANAGGGGESQARRDGLVKGYMEEIIQTQAKEKEEEVKDQRS